MKITIDPKDYMGGRITVMGIAAILITWFHSGVIVSAGSLLELFKVTGDIGVDLFLFASGVGIYLAVNKYASYWQYLFRRVRRVLIPYLCVCVPLYYYEMRMFGGGYSLLLKRILMLDFWTACNLESWYIASILTLYLITPFWIRLWKKYSWLHVGTFVAVLFCVAFLWDLPFFVNWKVFLGRIPVYLVGLTFGKLLLEKRVDSDTWGLVGGGCKKWEEPEQAMAREVYEELGWRIKPSEFKKVKVYGEPGRIAAFRDGSIWRMVIVVFALEVAEDRPIRISNESKEARFFSKEELQNIEIAVTHQDIVEECFVQI